MMEVVRRSIVCSVLVGASMALGACGSAPPVPAPDIDHVQEPVVSWIQFRGLCVWMLAVDGGGTLRTEESCEKGPEPLPARGQVAPSTVQQLRAAVEALPPTTATLDSCLGSAHLFGVRSAGTIERMVCADPTGRFGDPSTLAEPFLSVASLFAAIAPPPP